MNVAVERESRYLNMPLDLATRALLLVSALLLIATYFLPLWRIQVSSATDPEGFGLAVYTYKLEGVGGQENDVEVRTDGSPDSRWLPFVVGGLALLLLRGAAIGMGMSLVDLFVLFVYFSAFSFWTFAGRLDSYGSYLAAATRTGVSLFVPPLMGHERIGGLDVSSSPSVGSFAILAAGLALAVALIVGWRRGRSEIAGEVSIAG
jgi:hypothetical protein